MKRLFFIFLLIGLGLNSVSAQDANCDPAVVKEWMVQRQIGRNQLQSIIDGSDKTISFTDALLLVQKVRRELEDLPRPACADSLYDLTIYFYNAVGDLLTFGMAGDMASVNSLITPRLQRYSSGVDAIYSPLQTIAGVDVIAEAAARGSVVPTAAPTLTPLQFQGDTGGIVVGPTTIPAGVYKLTLTVAGATVNISSVSGNCSGYIYVPSDGTTTEEVFRSDGCSILIEIDRATKTWSLVFTAVS